MRFRVQLFILGLILSLLAGLVPRPVQADIRLLGDWTFTYTETDTEERDSDESIDSRTRILKQVYRLDIRRQLYPTLLVTGGALLEHNDLDSESSGSETEISSQTVRPYIDAEFANNLYELAAGYREIETKNAVSGQETTRQFVEEYDLRGEWRPTELPELSGSYTRTLRHDDPLTTDQETETFRFTGRYDFRDYEVIYDYLRSDDDQLVQDVETRIETHNGRVRHSRRFFDNRVSLNVRAQMEHSTVEFSGSGERVIRTTPRGTGFYLLEDPTPDINLPDDDFVSVPPGSFSDVNLGEGGGIQPVSLGLAFGDEARTDQVRVLLRSDPSDLNLAPPPQIANVANRFTWRVFVSDDQMDWVERSVTGVIYDQVENRFEIRFAPAAEEEFIKVMTTPLGPVAGIGVGGDIEVQDVQAWVSLPPDERDDIVTLSRLLNAGLTWQVSEQTRVGYDLSYQDQEVDAFDQENRQLTNGVNLLHRFGPRLSGSTRLLRTDRWEEGEHDSTAYNYSAQLAARYLETLSQSLTYSGSRISEPEGNSWSNAVFLRTNALLYPGWDASIDQGYTWQEDAEQGASSSFFVRLQNSITPHRRLSFVADYSVRWTEQDNRPNRRDQTGRLRGFWSPTDAFSLVGEIGVRETERGTFTDWLYGLNWLPFRDGSLLASIRYSEEGDSDDELNRSLSPSLTWRISRYVFLGLNYSQGTREDRSRKSDFMNAQMNLRIFYD